MQHRSHRHGLELAGLYTPRFGQGFYYRRRNRLIAARLTIHFCVLRIVPDPPSVEY